jgi:hypothetical protein
VRIPVVVAVCVTALCACKGKPSNSQAGGSGAAAGSATSMGALVPNKGSNVAPDIVLPHGDGTPPIKTTAPISPAKITELSALQFPGFLREVRKADSSLEVRHKTDSRPRIMATVFIESCAAHPCTPMELDKWKALGDSLKTYLAPALKTDANTDFEIGQTDLLGTPAIYTQQLAQQLGSDADGNMTGAYSYAYVLYYNDGVNQIRVVSAYDDDAMKTKADMVKSVPKADLEKIAKAFADIYTHKWQ